MSGNYKCYAPLLFRFGIVSINVQTEMMACEEVQL